MQSIINWAMSATSMIMAIIISSVLMFSCGGSSQTGDKSEEVSEVSEPSTVAADNTLTEAEIANLYTENGWQPEAELADIPFTDDFSTDKGWVNETNGDYVISNDRLEWNVA